MSGGFERIYENTNESLARRLNVPKVYPETTLGLLVGESLDANEGERKSKKYFHHSKTKNTPQLWDIEEIRRFAIIQECLNDGPTMIIPLGPSKAI